MLQWSFETYKSNERTDVQDEVDRYDEYSSQAFQRAVAHLAISSVREWEEPQAKKLKGEDPLYEIRYKANKRATRAIGYFRPSEKVFVIVLICFHKGRVYSPPDAFESAHKRIRRITDGSATTVPLTISGEIFPENEEESSRA